MNIALTTHLLAAVVWVGGMFFAYMVLRPVAVQVLQPPERLMLWAGVFARFFPWVWAAVILLLSSGFFMLMQIGMSAAPPQIHVMAGIAILMTLVFSIVYFKYYRELGRAVGSQEWKRGGEALGSIRKLIGFNLILGLCEIVIGALSRGF